MCKIFKEDKVDIKIKGIRVIYFAIEEFSRFFVLQLHFKNDASYEFIFNI